MATNTPPSQSPLSKLLLGQREKWLSGLGAFIAISGVILGTQWLLPQAVLVILPSMGASAVLLFALPHAPLSQPWPVFGGHMVSGCIGVAVQQVWRGDYRYVFFALPAPARWRYRTHGGDRRHSGAPIGLGLCVAGVPAQCSAYPARHPTL